MLETVLDSCCFLLELLVIKLCGDTVEVVVTRLSSLHQTV